MSQQQSDSTGYKEVISHAEPQEIPEIIPFVKAARKIMFPMLNDSSHDQHATKESSIFQRLYIEDRNGAFLTARVNGVLVATIAYVPYDDRFPYLRLPTGRIVEVIRLYVDPALRRCGLASRLLAALIERARQEGIDTLYLHTHPFLPGAVRFWENHGFTVMHVDDDPVWHTTHMCRQLSGVS